MLIINYLHEDNTYVIAEITKTKPKIPPTYYDQFKEPIEKWKQAGLHEKSYVKTHKLHRIESDKLINRIGKTDTTDFNNIIERVIEVNSQTK